MAPTSRRNSSTPRPGADPPPNLPVSEHSETALVGVPALWKTLPPGPREYFMKKHSLLAAVLLLASAGSGFAQEKAELLNASYDVSRELFVQINPAFQAAWKAKKGQELHIHQSHGGSSKQARAV